MIITTYALLVCSIGMLADKVTSGLPPMETMLSLAQQQQEMLTPIEFATFASSLSFINGTKCRNDLNATLWGIIAGERWAIAMYDATAKSAAGLASGVLHHFGHFDECLDARQHHADGDDVQLPVRAKYCLADVVSAITVSTAGSRSDQLLNHSVTHWGACVPASCAADDVAVYLQHLLQRDVTVSDEMCELQAYEDHVSNGMFIYAAVILFFLLLTALSTAYHIYLLWLAKRNEAVSKSCWSGEILRIALLSFSVIENTKKLFKSSKDHLNLNALNGIKALAMIFILAGHALLFVYGGPLYNTSFFAINTKVSTFAFLSNSVLFVDVFLLLSGFLFCRILLIELERRRGQINVLVLYVGRYIRLTPAYLVVIGFYMTWFPSIGNGPIWRQRLTREQERCLASWWSNILYINNYINTDKLCMFQSWYLSVDSQLFFVAPICIYMLYKSRKYGLHLLCVLVAASAVVPFVATSIQELDPTLMIYADEVNDLGSDFFYMTSYIKTHMRASAYFVGLLTGYLVHVMQEKGTTLPQYVVRVAWLLLTAAGVASMFSVTRFYNGSFTILESTMYAGFHKIGWNLSVAWLVLAVTTGHANWLHNVLSHRVFAPISRLTYCAYLSNGIVELYHSSSLKITPHMGYIDAGNTALIHVLDTFILAFFLCLIFESPIHALERILLRKNTAARQTKQSQANEERSTSPSTSEEQIA